MCEWGSGCNHWMSLDCLDVHLSKLVSPGLKDSIIRELKLRLNDVMRDVAIKHFNLNEE